METDGARSVVVVTFESEFNRFGGLGAVMGRLPKALLAHEHCVVVAPFFPALTDLGKLSETCDVHEERLAVSMPIAGAAYDVAVHEVVQRVATPGGDARLRTYLVASPGFFTAPRGSGPYVNPADPGRPLDPDTNPVDPQRLTEDALFLSAAVPHLLPLLIEQGLLRPDVVLHLQDWETAGAALAVREQLAAEHVQCVLTLHNPYDRELGRGDSAVATGLARHIGLGPGSLLAQAMDACAGPITTVSRRFAEELVTDPLMTHGFAPQLQGAFRAHGVRGVDNGQFIAPSFPAEALGRARDGDLSAVAAAKLERRGRLVAVLRDYRPPEVWGELRDLDTFDGPIFLMFGRDDPRQKGYDVAAAAIRGVAPGTAKFVFTPIPGDEGLAGLGFLRRLAEEERPGDVEVFPFKLAQGYKQLQEGCTFVLMPSLYEPFGGAIEGYASGTPVVARATGGLVAQVVPHTERDVGTGFLFREEVAPAVEVAGWERILACGYWDQRPRSDRIADRAGDELYAAMVAATRGAIEEAAAFYAADRQAGLGDYAGMIVNGFDRMARFSWERAAGEYRELY